MDISIFRKSSETYNNVLDLVDVVGSVFKVWETSVFVGRQVMRLERYGHPFYIYI